MAAWTQNNAANKAAAPRKTWEPTKAKTGGNNNAWGEKTNFDKMLENPSTFESATDGGGGQSNSGAWVDGKWIDTSIGKGSNTNMAAESATDSGGGQSNSGAWVDGKWIDTSTAKESNTNTAASYQTASHQSVGVDYASGNYHVTVKPGDTIWGISQDHPLPGVTTEQMMVGLFNANSHAFNDENINFLKAGVDLRIPHANEICLVTHQEAVAILKEHGIRCDNPDVEPTAPTEPPPPIQGPEPAPPIQGPALPPMVATVETAFMKDDFVAEIADPDLINGNLTDLEPGAVALRDAGTAATYIMEQWNPGVVGVNDLATDRLVKLLDTNAHDGAWLNDFYIGLGAEMSAAIINGVTTHRGGPNEQHEPAAKTIGQSLINLEKSGFLQEAGVQNLVEEMLVDGNDAGFSTMAMARLFPDDVTSKAGRDTVSKFANKLLEMSVVPDQNDPDYLVEIDGLRGWQEGNDILAAAATDLIAVLPPQDAMGVVFNLVDGNQTDGYDLSKVEEFFQRATTGNHDLQYHASEKVFIGNLSGTLDKIANGQVPGIPTETMDAIKVSAFGATIETVHRLDTSKDGFQFKDFSADVELKNSLAQLFADDGRATMDYFMEDAKMSRIGQEAFVTFFDMTLFTAPFGNDADHPHLQQHAVATADLLGELVDDGSFTVVNANDPENPFTKGSGYESKMAGMLLGLVDEAATIGSKRIADGQEARDNYVDIVVEFVFDLIPSDSLATLGKTGKKIIDRGIRSAVSIFNREIIGELENESVADAQDTLSQKAKDGKELEQIDAQQEAIMHMWDQSIAELGDGVNELKDNPKYAEALDHIMFLQNSFQDGYEMITDHPGS